MQISRPQDVEYLALEGGGGKGVTYLGAIRALENLGVLPIDINRPGQNQIKGISGASAGAITALMLAMGLDSTELQRILSNASTFTGFFDGPNPGMYRTVDSRNEPDIKTDAPAGTRDLDFIQARQQSISGWSQLAGMFGALISSGAFGRARAPTGRRLAQQPRAYLATLLFARRWFPGLAPRRFLRGAVSGYLSQRIPHPTGRVIVCGTGSLSFSQFFPLTGVDLAIT